MRTGVHTHPECNTVHNNARGNEHLYNSHKHQQQQEQQQQTCKGKNVTSDKVLAKPQRSMKLNSDAQTLTNILSYPMLYRAALLRAKPILHAVQCSVTLLHMPYAPVSTTSVLLNHHKKRTYRTLLSPSNYHRPECCASATPADSIIYVHR